MRKNLTAERGQTSPQRGALLNSGSDLVRRMLIVEQLRQRLGQNATEAETLELELADLSVQEARQEVEFNRAVLQREQSAKPAAPPLRLFQRTVDLLNSILVQMTRELRLAERRNVSAQSLQVIRAEVANLRERYDGLRAELDQVVSTRQLDLIPQLVQNAETLLGEAQAGSRGWNSCFRAGRKAPKPRFRCCSPK